MPTEFIDIQPDSADPLRTDERFAAVDENFRRVQDHFVQVVVDPLSGQTTLQAGGESVSVGENPTQPIIKSGMYVGTGSGQLLNLGFRPDLIIIKGAGGPGAMFNDGHWYGGPQGFGGLVLDGPDSYARPCINDSGLVIEENSGTYYNAAGVTYHYVAVKDNGSGMLRTVAYNGYRNQTTAENGVNSNPVVMDALEGFGAPDLLYIKRDAKARDGVWAAADFVKPANGAPENTLLTVNADGSLNLGTDPRINENNAAIIGEAHHVVALYRSGQHWRFVSRTGTGGDVLLTMPADVAAVIVLPLNSQPMEFWIDGMGAQSGDGAVAPLNTGRIAVSGSVVTLSGVCNEIGVDYRVAVIYKRAASEVKTPAIGRRHGVAIVTDGSGVVDCGSSDTLAIAGAHSVEWAGYITDSNSEQFIFGRMTGGRGSPTAGSCNWAMAYTRDPDSGLEICTSDRFSQQTTEASKQQRFRTGLVLEPWKPVHILYTHDGVDKWLVYINGQLRKWRRLPMSIFGLPGITATTGLRTSFGSRYSGSNFVGARKTGHYFGRVYNRELTPDEVSRMFARNFMSQNLRDVSDSATSLVEEWRFLDATALTVTATKSSANNGAMTGAAWVVA